jgi:hypothetical protein
MPAPFRPSEAARLPIPTRSPAGARWRRLGGWLAGGIMLLSGWSTPLPAAGQTFAVEARAGGAVGNYTGTAAGLELAPRLAGAVAVEARALRFASPYVAFTWAGFGCRDGFCTDRDVSLVSRGAGAGVRWHGTTPWIRTGLVYHSLHVRSVAGEESGDPALGFEVAGGASIRVGRGLELTPQLSYTRHPARTEQRGHAALLGAGLGLRLRFGPG